MIKGITKRKKKSKAITCTYSQGIDHTAQRLGTAFTVLLLSSDPFNFLLHTEKLKVVGVIYPTQEKHPAFKTLSTGRLIQTHVKSLRCHTDTC